MGTRKKVALLDTDFLLKSYRSQKDPTHCLGDVVLGLSDYDFCCHQKTVEEFSVYSVGDSVQWLQAQISSGKICCYTDRDILNKLEQFYGIGAQSKYLEYLKKSCDAFAANYYITHFAPLDALPTGTEDEVFLTTLEQCECAIGRQRSLGEKKSLLLLQLFQFLQPGNVYQFCSDDRGARAGVVSIGGVCCISILSLFALSREQGASKEEMEPYWNAFEAFVKKHHQETFKVCTHGSSLSFCKIPCRQVFDEIYVARFIRLDTGDLKYL